MNTLKAIGKVVLVFLGVILVYLVAVIFGPGFSVAKQPLPVSEKTKRNGKQKSPESRQDVSFQVDGQLVKGWLFLPKAMSKPVPCVVMNHGLGGTNDFIIERYALRFQAAGMAVLAYDYRHFGMSEGQPRQFFSIPKQLEDLKAAVSFARSRSEIDPEKIAIWGTSAGGGYGLALAAEDKKIACICAQCPALDSDADGKAAVARDGIGSFLRLFVHAQRDKGRSRFDLSAHKIPLVGKPGTVALITGPGAFEGYAQLVSENFINEICARSLLYTGGFNPIDHAADVECPVLIHACEEDNLVTPESAVNTAKILGERAELRQFPIGHFDIYQGEWFETAVTDQTAFFQKHLGLVSSNQQ